MAESRPTNIAEAVRARARARQRKAEAESSSSEAKSENPIRRWNKGLVDLIAAPTDMINAGIRVATWATTPPYVKAAGVKVDPLQIPSMGDPERQLLADRGYIPDPNEPADTIMDHAAEILGGGIIPHAGLTTKGNQVLSQSIKQFERMGVFDHLVSSTSRRPVAVAGGEAVASFGAGTGRAIAQENEASMPVQIMAELAGGFAPAAVLGVAGRVSTIRFISNSVKKHLLPFTKEGAWPRASKRLRDVAADPEKSADRIKDKSPISPARQAGDEGLLKLEKSVLDENPDMASEFDTALLQAREELKTEVLSFFGGDPSRPRQLLVSAKNYLTSLLDARAGQAATRLEAELSRLDPNATPRDISQRVRGVVDSAYADARTTEKQLWDSIDSNAPVKLDKSKDALSGELARRSEFDDPTEIPAWLVKSLSDSELSPSLKGQLQKAGAIDSNGDFVPGMKERLINEGIISDKSFKFNDARAIRSRLLQDIRTEQAKDAPNRNKIRILSKVADGLLDDIGTSGVEGAASAREFSFELNNRFTKGKVGRLLGYDRTGAERVSQEATLDYLLSGGDPVATINQLITASPSSRPMISDYLKAEFIAKTGGGANRSAMSRFVDAWERKGAFEVFPELRAQFRRYGSISEAAERLSVRADKVRSYANKSGKSTAALYLDSDPGTEIQSVLNSKRPATNARKLRAKMKGDYVAEQGLRTQFLEEAFNSSASGKYYADGEAIYSGTKFTKFLSDNKSVASQLGIRGADWSRLENIALRMRQIEVSASGSAGKSINDAPAAIIDLAARYVGAQQGGRLGNSMGSSLVMAGAFSKRIQALLERVTRGTAKQMLMDAHRDPALYRALLTNTNAPKPRQDKAEATIKAWLAGIGVTEESE